MRVRLGANFEKFDSLRASRPDLVRERRLAGQLFDQLPGNLHLAVVLVAQLTDVHRGVAQRVFHEVAAFDGREQLTDERRGEHLVHHAGEQRKLPGAVFDTAIGHVGFLVPMEHTGRRGQRAGLLHFRQELVVGLLRLHTPSPFFVRRREPVRLPDGQGAVSDARIHPFLAEPPPFWQAGGSSATVLPRMHHPRALARTRSFLIGL